MATEIVSCGLPGAEKLPDALDTLLRALDEYQLAPRFLDYGGFIRLHRDDKRVQFHGNFLALSHVFDIRTDNPDVVYVLTSAINANLDREWPGVNMNERLPQWLLRARAPRVGGDRVRWAP